MEAFKVFEQMNQVAGNLSQDPQMQKRLKEFWSMLEELSANSPEEYQKFIETQLKTGLEDIKKEEDAKKTEVSVKLGGCLKIRTKKGEEVFVNLCHCDKALGPLKSDRTIADPLDLDSWATVPASFAERGRGSGGELYFDAVINTAAYIQMSRNDRLRAHVSRNILMRLEKKAQLGMLIDVAEVEYYLGEYCGLPENKGPALHKLEPAADPRDYEKYMGMIKEAHAAGQLDVQIKPNVSAEPELPQIVSTPPKAVTIEEIANYKEALSVGTKPDYSVFVER
mmetsp:Transcript_24034/g.42711  ORF Transcript_24034/g.42711 Transcript_24034/m.42711 type:complete len:281 (-) Transcript_24034:223-1065(-)